MLIFFDTKSLITSSPTFGVKFIGFPVLGSPVLLIKTKENFNVEYIEIDITFLKNPAILKNTARIYNYGKKLSE